MKRIARASLVVLALGTTATAATPQNLARGLDPKNVHHLGQVFGSRPSPRQRGVIKNVA